MPTREGDYLTRRAIEEARKAHALVHGGDTQAAAFHDRLATRYLQLAQILSRFAAPDAYLKFHWLEAITP